jgi:superfamily I DNA/RNA helicase
MTKATLIPATVPEKATSGEKRVYRLLRQQLPEGFVAWFELPLSYRRSTDYPDFVIIGPDEGIIVLEVKDWVLNNITTVKRTLFNLRGTRIAEHDPFDQARQYALSVNNILQSDNNPLIVHQSGREEGKLKFPYRHAVVMTNISRAEMEQLRSLQEIMENEPLLVKDDMGEGFVERILSLPSRFQAPMTAEQIQAVRWKLYPEERIAGKPGRVVDLEQANLIKSHLSEEAERAAGDPLTRLVRGPAGSGKSLILIKRAIMESLAHPNWRVLVLTFNRQLSFYLRYLIDDSEGTAAPDNLEIVNFHTWCRRALKSIGSWNRPIGDRQRRELISQAIDSSGPIDLSLSKAYIGEEISWIKENELLSWKEYKNVDRAGRGIGLAESPRRKVYNVFQEYQQLLGNRMDWDDVPLRVLQNMENSLISTGNYEAVFVDEAQDFAASWFRVIRSLVNPDTSILFLAADSTQRIYRTGFSWQNMGLNVRGRTVVLKRRYRNPFAVQRLAYNLVRNDEGLQRELSESGEVLSEPESDTEQEPINDSVINFKRFHNEREEYTAIANAIKTLLKQGYRNSDIAIFHRYKWGVDEIAEHLAEAKLLVNDAKESDINFNEDRIRISTLHSSKGLEFPIVFICGLDRISYGLKFKPQDPEQQKTWLEEWLTEEKKLLYVGITRATELLFLSYHGPLPAFIQKIEHDYRVNMIK